MSVEMQSRDKNANGALGDVEHGLHCGVLRVEVVVTAFTVEEKNIVPLTPSSKVWPLLYGLSRKSQMVNNVVW